MWYLTYTNKNGVVKTESFPTEAAADTRATELLAKNDSVEITLSIPKVQYKLVPFIKESL